MVGADCVGKQRLSSWPSAPQLVVIAAVVASIGEAVVIPGLVILSPCAVVVGLVVVSLMVILLGLIPPVLILELVLLLLFGL